MADTVLIVDNEPLVLNVLSEMLEDNNFAVLKAKNADHTLELAADRRDISPRPDGRQLAHHEWDRACRYAG